MAKAAAATARGSKRRAASDADATPSSGKKAKKNAKKSKSSAKKRSDGDAHGWRPLPVRLDFGSAQGMAVWDSFLKAVAFGLVPGHIIIVLLIQSLCLQASSYWWPGVRGLLSVELACSIFVVALMKEQVRLLTSRYEEEDSRWQLHIWLRQLLLQRIELGLAGDAYANIGVVLSHRDSLPN